ncbi:CPCC family cysteine-rich protein [Streptomyces sp. QTS137]
MSDRSPCPCCGHRVLDAMPGSYEICSVCFREDDGVQFRWPTMASGANKVSLIEAQRNVQDFGACDQQGRRYVRQSAASSSNSTASRTTRPRPANWSAPPPSPTRRCGPPSALKPRPTRPNI